MHSKGLSQILATLLKLGATGMGRSTRLGARRFGGGGGEQLLVGSDNECLCPFSGLFELGLRGLRLDCPLDDTRNNGADTAKKFESVTGGHKGLFGSRIGLEIELLSIEVCEREERLLPFIVIVSLLHEKARFRLGLSLLWGVLRPDSRGGVIDPTGSRSSTSLFERFILTMVASSSIVASAQGGRRAIGRWVLSVVVEVGGIAQNKHYSQDTLSS